MTDDKIQKLIEKIGFIFIEDKYTIKVGYSAYYYPEYYFGKRFRINETLPFYTLCSYTKEVFDTDNKEEAYQKLKEIFKKEIRVYKIKQLK